jgi:hypothetical protein
MKGDLVATAVGCGRMHLTKCIFAVLSSFVYLSVCILPDVGEAFVSQTQKCFSGAVIKKHSAATRSGNFCRRRIDSYFISCVFVGCIVFFINLQFIVGLAWKKVVGAEISVKGALTPPTARAGE